MIRHLIHHLPLITALLLHLILIPQSEAGEKYGPYSFVLESDVIALVSVDLRKNTVQLQELLYTSDRVNVGDATERHQEILQAITGDHSSICLPRKKRLQLWIKTSRYDKREKKLWRDALKHGHYQGVFHLRYHPKDKVLRVFCGVELPQVESWSEHPEFKRWYDETQLWILLKKLSASGEVDLPPHWSIRYEEIEAPNPRGPQGKLKIIYKDQDVSYWDLREDSAQLSEKITRTLPLSVYLGSIHLLLNQVKVPEYTLYSKHALSDLIGETWSESICHQIIRYEWKFKSVKTHLDPEVWYRQLAELTPLQKVIHQLSHLRGWQAQFDFGEVNQFKRCAHKKYARVPYDTASHTWKWLRSAKE